MWKWDRERKYEKDRGLWYGEKLSNRTSNTRCILGKMHQRKTILPLCERENTGRLRNEVSRQKRVDAPFFSNRLVLSSKPMLRGVAVVFYCCRLSLLSKIGNDEKRILAHHGAKTTCIRKGFELRRRSMIASKASFAQGSFPLVSILKLVSIIQEKKVKIISLYIYFFLLIYSPVYVLRINKRWKFQIFLYQ